MKRDRPLAGKVIVTIAIALAAVGLAPVGRCAPGAPKIWEEALMKERFDTEPFRPVKLPEWMENTTALVFGPDPGTGIVDAKSAEAAAKAGAQLSQVFLGDFAYMNYDSKLLPSNPKLKEEDVRKGMAELKKRGIRIIASYWPCYQAKMCVEHPDWRLVSSHTGVVPEVNFKESKHGGRLCELGPWGDMVVEIAAEILTKFPEVDGFTFDGFQHDGVCYCVHCRENYKRDTGEEIPERNMNDDAFRRYLLWEDRQFEKLAAKFQARIKGINPNAVNASWTTNSGRMMHYNWIPHTHSARTNLLWDAPTMEFWLDEEHRGNSMVPAFGNAYMWALTNQRVAFSEPYMMTHMVPYGTDSFPQNEALVRGLLLTTYGCRPAYYMHWSNHGESTLQHIAEVQKRAPWMTHIKSEPWAALLMSDQTRTFYGRDGGKVETRYISNVVGAFRAGIEEHLALNVITDWNLNAKDLARYKVLVMPNAACLSDQQIAAVDEFVKNGGGLVATLDTSLFDELSNPRKDFGLADVFGVHYLGAPSLEPATIGKPDPNFINQLGGDYWEKRRSAFDLQMGKHELFDNDKLKQYVGSSSVVFRGPAVTVGNLSAGATSIGDLQIRKSIGEPAAKEVAPIPGIVVREHGKGRVVYMAAGFDSGYYLYPFTYERLLIGQAMRWAAKKPFGISVQAPM
ncbi:MAG: beta-galactosidase trimerization domain-containing protein, partial [Armatimonadota bacterium]